MTPALASFPGAAVTQRVAYLSSMRSTLVAYMRAKIEDSDWHAISDAANDLREVDAELKGLKAGPVNG